MQRPATVNLTWQQGRTNNVTFGVYSDAAHETPVNLTGTRWILEARKGLAADTDLVLRKDSDESGEVTLTSAASGLVTFNFPPSDTDDATWKDLFYEAVCVWPAGSTLTYFTGKIELRRAFANVEEA